MRPPAITWRERPEHHDGEHPLYHYDDDHRPGQTEGQGSTEFGAKWYVLAASANKIDDD